MCNNYQINLHSSIGYRPRLNCALTNKSAAYNTLLHYFVTNKTMDSKQLNDFFQVPRLPNNGKGFVIWKERVELSIQARGLFGHLDGSATKPEDPPTRAVGATLTEDEVRAIGKHAKDLNTYLQEQAIVFQQIASTIPDSLYLKIKGKPTVQQAWNVLKADFEKRSQMITVEL